MKSKQNDAELIAEAYANVEVQEENIAALAAGAGNALRTAGTAAAKGASNVGKALVSEPAKKVYKTVGKTVKKGVETVGGAALGAVGGAAEGAAKMVGGAIEGTVGAVGGAVQGAVDGATGGIGKAAKGAVGLGAEDGEHEGKEMAPIAGMKNVTKRKLSGDELQAKVNKSIKLGHITSADGASIMHMHNRTSDEDGEQVGKQAGHPAGDGSFEARNARAHELAMAKAKAGVKEDAEHAAPIEVDMSENPAPESLEVTKEEEPNHEPCAAMDVPSITVGAEMPEPMNHQDRSEMEMAKAELYKLEKYSFKLGQMLDHLPALEGWTASKITKAADYLSSVYHKLDYDLHGDENGIKSEDHEGH